MTSSPRVDDSSRGVILIAFHASHRRCVSPCTRVETPRRGKAPPPATTARAAKSPQEPKQAKQKDGCVCVWDSATRSRDRRHSGLRHRSAASRSRELSLGAQGDDQMPCRVRADSTCRQGLASTARLPRGACSFLSTFCRLCSILAASLRWVEKDLGRASVSRCCSSTVFGWFS